ncbi:unnamed protein product [Spirodela intermedia]|uniref:Uncharacterized protein n=1 Tax=Spirodela intermedia TaxID=51605 RepID=A0A7I8IAP8_SPIIN|nr:unnamed protein product [Spirodela intermedia]CAA6654112.1 unnamed protein product [Spirodela intermedia]
MGYRDGIIAGKEASAQEGFNAGFKKAVLGGTSGALSEVALTGLPDSPRGKLAERIEKKDALWKLCETQKDLSSAGATASGEEGPGQLGSYYGELNRSAAGFRGGAAFSLNSTIRSLLASGRPQEALARFLDGHRRGLARLDSFTIPPLLKLSHALRLPLFYAEHLHAVAVKLYFQRGRLTGPRNLFDECPRGDAALWTAMISGLSRIGRAEESLGRFFAMLEQEGIEPTNMTAASVLSACAQLKEPDLGKALHGFLLRGGLLDEADAILETALLDMYAKCGEMIYARRVFDKMPERSNSGVAWNSMITGCSESGLYQAALELLRGMLSSTRLRPRWGSLSAALGICGATGDLRKGKQLHGYILKAGSNGPPHVDGLAQGGCLRSATALFGAMPRRNVATWTALMSVYGAHGLGRRALEVFGEMKQSGVEPDGVAFLALLTACSHCGLVREGEALFQSMELEHNIAPEMKHFVCMVDLYGRAGLLQEARDFIERMPAEPPKFAWVTLLASCRNHKDLRLGELAAIRALQLDPREVGFTCICQECMQMQGGGGRWPRCTDSQWCADHMSGNSARIRRVIKSVRQMMTKAGLLRGKAAFDHHVGEEENAEDLCGHTEKIALAFALTEWGGWGVIRIGKNLRVCRDCHEMFKFVSMISGVEILLKDPNRYHRFGRAAALALTTGDTVDALAIL